MNVHGLMVSRLVLSARTTLAPVQSPNKALYSHEYVYYRVLIW